MSAAGSRMLAGIFAESASRCAARAASKAGVPFRIGFGSTTAIVADDISGCLGSCVYGHQSVTWSRSSQQKQGSLRRRPPLLAGTEIDSNLGPYPPSPTPSCHGTAALPSPWVAAGRRLDMDGVGVAGAASCASVTHPRVTVRRARTSGVPRDNVREGCGVIREQQRKHTWCAAVCIEGDRALCGSRRLLDWRLYPRAPAFTPPACNGRDPFRRLHPVSLHHRASCPSAPCAELFIQRHVRPLDSHRSIRFWRRLGHPSSVF